MSGPFNVLVDWSDTATEAMKGEVRKLAHTLGYALTLNTTDHRGIMLTNRKRGFSPTFP